MSSTLQVIRNRIIDDLGLGHTRASIDSLAAGSLTEADFLRNTNFGLNQFIGWGIHRPDAATAADRFRYAGALTNSTGLLAHTGANYADTTATSETWNLLAPGIRPDEDIDPAINRALEYVFYHGVEPISLIGDDSCMRASSTSAWTASNSTLAKTTTASRVFPGMGIRALTVTNTSAGGYAGLATALYVTPGEQVFVATISRMQSGTRATQVVYDSTNGAVIGTSSYHNENTWQYMQQIATVPAGCHVMQIQLTGTGASDVIDWQAVWAIRQNILRYNLPSYLDERYKVDSIATLNFAAANANATGTVMDALSVNPEELPASMYATDFPMPEANPTYVQFHTQSWRNMWARRFGPQQGAGSFVYAPLVVQMRLPYSERGTLSAEADATTCPLHLIVPAAEVQLLESCPAAAAVSTKSLAQCKAEFVAASGVRATSGPAKRPASWRMARASN